MEKCYENINNKTVFLGSQSLDGIFTLFFYFFIFIFFSTET